MGRDNDTSEIDALRESVEDLRDVVGGIDESLEAAIGSLTNAVVKLGTNDSDTRMGALELLAKELRDGFGTLAAAVDRLAVAIEEKKS